MSKDFNNKEKKFKEVLDNMEIDLNTDQLWSSLSSELPTKKKKRFGWIPYFVLISGILISIAIGVYYNGMEYTHNSVQVKTKPESQEKNLASHHKKDTQIPRKLFKVEQTSKATERNTKLKILPVGDSSREFKQDVEFTLDTKQSVIKIPTKIKAEYFNAEQLVNSKAITDSEGAARKTQNEQPRKKKVELTKHEQVFSRNKVASALFLESLSFDALESDASETRIDERVSNSILPVRKDSWKTIIMFKAGLNQNFSSNTLSDNTELFNAEILELENDEIGFNSELGLGMAHSSGWRFTGGLNYSTFFSSFSSTQIEIEESEIPGTETIIINPDGSHTLVQGSLQKTSTTETEFLWHRRHKRIDVQLLVGKSLVQWNNIALGIDLGLRYNIWANDKGYYFDDNLEFVKIQDAGETVYNTRHGIGYSTALNFEYKLGKVNLGLTPFLRINPNSISKASHIYSNKNQQVGLNASLSYFID